MSKVLVSEEYLSDIADAIRAKNNTNTVYLPGDMAQGILDLNLATEYTIPNTVTPGHLLIFDLTSVGLTADDFTLVNTKMWVEFLADDEISANLDREGDDIFNVTIPAGTIAECTQCSNNVGVFAFSGGSSKPYGFFTLEKDSMDNTCRFLSDGTDPSYGCIVATTGYRTANVGCPEMMTYQFANLFVLHILKLN